MDWSFLSSLLALAKKLGPKLQQAWPILLHMYSDIQQIITILNDGVPVSMAASMTPKGVDIAVTTEQGRELVKVLCLNDPSRESEAKQLAAALENLDSKLRAA